METHKQSASPLEPDSAGTRRRLLAGVALASAGLGALGAWWLRSHAAHSGGSADTAGTDDAQAPVPGFWSWRWDGLHGQSIGLAQFQHRPLLLNFWATWCDPCVRELPMINDFYRQQGANGFQVLGIAVDRPEAVQSFLTRMPLDFPIGIAGMSGVEMARALGDVSGGLPFSLGLDGAGRVILRKPGALDAQDLAALASLK